MSVCSINEKMSHNYLILMLEIYRKMKLLALINVFSFIEINYFVFCQIVIFSGNQLLEFGIFLGNFGQCFQYLAVSAITKKSGYFNWVLVADWSRFKYGPLIGWCFKPSKLNRGDRRSLSEKEEKLVKQIYWKSLSWFSEFCANFRHLKWRINQKWHRPRFQRSSKIQQDRTQTTKEVVSWER